MRGGARHQQNRKWCGTFSGEVLSCFHGPPPQLVDQVVYMVLVAQEEGPDHPLVQDLGAVPAHGGHAPQQEETLWEERGVRT